MTYTLRAYNAAGDCVLHGEGTIQYSAKALQNGYYAKIEITPCGT